MLDPRRVLTFREVAHLGSFSRAADALALTQPAVSQQVAALERQLGTRLLHRGPGGLTLTPAGELLLEHSDVVADRLELATSQLDELVGREQRYLRVGAYPSALATVVPRALAQLTDLKADVSEGTMEALAEEVASGALHVALCFQDSTQERREPAGTERVDVEEEPFTALLPPGHRLAGKGPLRLRDLAEETWVAPSRSGLIVRACQAAGFTPAIRCVSRDPLANRGLVAAGLAASISPARLTAEFHGVAVEALRDGPTRSVYALLPSAGASELARAFVAALRRT